ncbi:MAG TPA: hypothetical protein VND93_27865 [Myxococcales bacterium]|jgi:hypothetical protein|nr:hypothetical protein [Myxococcales bacterium]
MAEEPREIIQPHDGLLGDPAVPVREGAPPVRVRQRPAFGINPMSGWLFSVAAGLFAVATGAGILMGPMAHALLLWAAILVGHFAVSYFMWVDPLPSSRFVAIPLGVAAMWGFFALSFLLIDVAPRWSGWTLAILGLLAVAAGVVPLTAAWVEPREMPVDRRVEA